MKIADIINQLRGVIPKYTDYFSDSLSVLTITASGGTATIVTSTAHGLSGGENIVLKDVLSKNFITNMTQSGLVFTLTTGADHDLTYGWPEHEYVTLSGFNQTEWNDSFYLLSVPNRRTFTVRSANVIPGGLQFPLVFPWTWKSFSGNEHLLENRIDGINGRYSVTVIDPVTLQVTGDFDDGSYVGGSITTNHRIGGAVTEERAIEQYTQQQLDNYWMFVVMGDASISKDRSTYSDATATKSNGNDMRIRLIDNYSLFIIVNVTQDITAINALDVCRHDILLPILRCLNGVRFTSGLTYSGDFKSILTGHNVFGYNRAVFVYRYDFELVMDLTNDDTVAPEDTRAFRDIDYYLTIGGDDTDQMTILPIDLDDEPL